MRFLKGKTGFILVELIIATAILAAVIPLSKFFIDTMKATRETKIRQTATHLAQTYMEEYKSLGLEVIKNIEDEKEEVDGREYYVSVEKTPFLASGDSENCLGSINITKVSDSEIRLQVVSTKSDGESISSSALPNYEYTLEINDAQIKLWQGEAYNSIATISPQGEPELNLFVENNPKLTLNVKNNLDKNLIINSMAVGSDLFKLVVKQGKVGVRDNESIEDYQRGAHIIVTVKDKAGDAGEILAEVAQTRLIEWAESKE